MNKKKSKALAFLLAASLLVPSANGIVSAAELRGNEVVVEESTVNVNNSSTEVVPPTEGQEDVTEVDSLNGFEEALKQGKKNIVITQNLTLTKGIEVKVEGAKISGKTKDITISGGSAFTVNAKNVTIENLKINNTEVGSTKFTIGGNLEKATIQNCEFEGQPVYNLINCADTTALIFKGNTLEMNARALIVGASNGSIIEGNKINLKSEKYNNTEERASVISVIAKENLNGDVKIINNEFKNANRAIGVDWSNISGDRITIKNNKFIDTRFAFEVGSNDDNNIGKSYDLSENYYNHKDLGGVGPLRIEDASAKDKSHFEEEEKGSTRLELKDETQLNIAVGPYYTTEDESGNLGGVVNNGVATVNGKDYQTLAKAIEAAQSGQTVTIHKDVELTKANGILVDKNITINSTNNAKLILNGEYTLGVTGSGHLTLSGMTIELKKPEVNYLRNQGATLEVVGCKIAPTNNIEKFQTAGNLIADNRSNVSYEDRAKSKIILTKNEISLHARGLVSSVGNGSEIIGNTFDLCGEEFIYTDGRNNRTGVLSIIADDIEGEDKKVIIEGNTFKNANRAIGVDHSKIKGKNLIIKKNKFIDTRYAFEVDVRNSQENKNLNKKYDISGNYFEFAGKVSEPKIQDANADSKDRISDKSEVKAEDAKAAGVGLDDWPYYTNESCTHLSNESYGPSKPSYTHKEIIG